MFKEFVLFQFFCVVTKNIMELLEKFPRTQILLFEVDESIASKFNQQKFKF